MNKTKKMLAVLLAVSAIGGGVSVPVSAEEIENVEMLVQVEELAESGRVTQSAYELLHEQVEILNNTNTTYYIPAYDYYDEYHISPTTHYLAPIVPSGAQLESASVYFYLNLNILPSNVTNSSRLKLGRNYTSGGYVLGNISTTSDFPLAKTVAVPFNLAGTMTASCGELFTYRLGTFGASVTAESWLNRYTNSNPNVVPSLDLLTSASNGYTAKKCVYSVGDVNRDGEVNDNDSMYLLQYLVNGTVPNPSRVASGESGYDIVAFELAGDCNDDGEIDIIDVVTLNQYLAGLETTLPA